MFIGLLLLAGMPKGVMAAQPVTVTIDGVKVELAVAPLLVNGRVLAPLRPILVALGKEVNWEPATKTITAKTPFGMFAAPTNTVRLTVGQQVAYLDGDPVELDVPARIMNNRILAPLRFVAEAVGAEVNWEGQTSTVVVKYQQRYYDQVINHLHQGDLVQARQAVINSPQKNAFPYMGRHADLSIGETYYFPEGEATRFYKLEGSKISFVQAVNGVFTVTWQARFDSPPDYVPGGTPPNVSGRLLASQDSVSQFLTKRKQYIIIEEYGTQPLVKQPLVFFHRMPTVWATRYGKIKSDGTEEVIGAQETQESVIAIPGETATAIFP